MTHCFKTSHLIKFPLCLASRCGTLEWNFIHRSSQPAAAPVSVLARHVRPFSSVCVWPPALEPAGPAPPPAAAPQLARCVAQLSRQLAALEAARQLQTTGHTAAELLRQAALSPCERRALRLTALRSRPPPPAGGEEERGERRGGQDGHERPTPDQLRVVEANLLKNLPRLFVMTQDFTIYHKDLVFDNRIRGTKTVGIVPYIKQCALLRVVGHIKFSYVKLDILQSATHTEDDTIRIRWRIRGVSALKSMLMFWKFNVFKLKNAIDDYGVDWYDGYSIFQVGGDGKIHTHIADKVMPDWGRETVVKPALGGLAALVLGLLPGATGAGDQLGQLLAAASVCGADEQLDQLRALAARLEQLERQIDTLLPLPPCSAQFKAAGDT